MLFRPAVMLACAALIACDASDQSPLDSDASHSDTTNDTYDAESSASGEDTSVAVGDAVAPEVEVASDVELDSDAELEVLDDVAEVVDASEILDDVVEVVEDVEDTSTEDATTSDDIAVEVEVETLGEADTIDDSSDAEVPDAAACISTLLTRESESQSHIPSCSAVTYSTNPPTSGDHYGVWPQWKVYKMPVPRGFYVHGLEHGGIVFAYNCPDGCKDEIDALIAMLAERPVDTQCPLGVANRFIVTPDPLLDVRFAAAAWEESLKADCMDLAAMAAFIDAHYGHGPERDCIQGADVSNSSIAGTYCPPSCSWCNPPIP